jgi:hypothetical protein
MEVPLQANFAPADAAVWFGEWARVKGAAELTITLHGDAELGPAAISLLAAGIADRGTVGLPTQVRVEHLGDDARRSLRRIDFFRELGLDGPEPLTVHERSGLYVRLRRVLDFATADELASETARCIAAELPDLAPSPLRMSKFVFEELGANIVQHSSRAATGFGLARASGRERRLEISFADAGVGFLASLQRNPEFRGRIADDAEALQLALSPHVTGTSGSRTNMGFGLKLLAGFSDHLGGDLWIASGGSLLLRRTTVSKQRTNVLRSVAAWQGSWICLDAPL